MPAPVPDEPSGRKWTVVLAAAALLTLAAIGGYVALDIARGAEKTSTQEPTATAGADEASATAIGSGSAPAQEPSPETASGLDANGRPFVTVADLDGAGTTAEGDVTLFGAIAAALEAMADETGQTYPVNWGADNPAPDGSADSWYFTMADADVADRVLTQIKLGRDGEVLDIVEVDRDEVGLGSDTALGSYPPGALDSPELWAASPHPLDCPTIANLVASFWWAPEDDVPVVMFYADDPVCFPDTGTFYAYLDPRTGELIERPE